MTHLASSAALALIATVAAGFTRADGMPVPPSEAGVAFLALAGCALIAMFWPCEPGASERAIRTKSRSGMFRAQAGGNDEHAASYKSHA